MSRLYLLRLSAGQSTDTSTYLLCYRQAYATRAEFDSQRSVLEDISTRMSSTAQQVPGLNSVITLIGRRRRRDSVIMGVLVGTCTVLLLMFLTR